MRLFSITVVLSLMGFGVSSCAKPYSHPSQSTSFRRLASQSVTYVNAPKVHQLAGLKIPAPRYLMPIDKRMHAGRQLSRHVSKQTAVRRANRLATRVPKSNQFFNAVMTYDYSEGALYVVYAAPLHITDLIFSPNEKLLSEASGDTVRWQIAKTYSGMGSMRREHLLIKPNMSNIENGLIVTTTQHVYHIILRATTNNTYMVSVSWRYPGGLVRQLDNGYVDTNTMHGNEQFDLNQMNFDYQFGMVSGHKPVWYPLRVFDNGRKIFVELPRGINHFVMPVIYVSGNDDNYTTALNWKIKGRYFVIDRLATHIRLMTGVASRHNQTVVQIIRRRSA